MTENRCSYLQVAPKSIMMDLFGQTEVHVMQHPISCSGQPLERYPWMPKKQIAISNCDFLPADIHI